MLTRAMCEYDAARNMDPTTPFSERQLLRFLSLMPFVDSAELAGILDEPHATVHRTLAGLLPEGTVERVSHGTAQLPSTQRYYLTANAISDRPGSCSALRRHLQPHDEG